MSEERSDRSTILTLRDHVLREGKGVGLELVPWTTPMLDPVPDWLVPNLLQENAIHVLTADSGSYKSWLGLSLALSGLFGFPVLGQLPTRPFSSIYLAADSPRWDIGQQLRKLRLGNNLVGIRPFDDTHLFIMPLGFLFDNEDHVRKITDIIRHWDIEAFFIDVMLYSHSGDENDNSYMARSVLRAAKYLRDVADVAVYFIHHNAKPREGMAVGFRGAGTIIQAAEHHFVVRRFKDKHAALKVKKVRGEEVIEEEIHYELSRRNNGRVLVPLDSYPPQREVENQVADIAVPGLVDVLHKLGPSTRATIQAAMPSLGSKAIDNSLSYLKAKGRIRREGSIWIACQNESMSPSQTSSPS